MPSAATSALKGPPGLGDSRAGHIAIRGASTHNLAAVNVDIPRNQLVVVTGVSGSGKSSLAFDTLHAEGQRRYLDTLSPAARLYIDQLPRADIASISGLPPTLAIRQVGTPPRARTLLATLTEIHDYLRVLYARAGTPQCPTCHTPVTQQSTDSVVRQILSLPAGLKAMILAPLVRGKKGTHLELFGKIAKQGLVRARVDGEVIDISQPPPLKKTVAHSIEAVIDRIIVKPGIESRLIESVELAVKLSGGTCLVSHQEGDTWSDRLFSTRLVCPTCEQSLPPIEPRTFSFNSPYGACAACGGLGRLEQVEHEDSIESQLCAECGGGRLSAVGRAVLFQGVSLPAFLAGTVTTAANQISAWRRETLAELDPARREVTARILPDIENRLRFLEQVGLGYVELERPARTLSGGELQRARVAQALGAGLVGVCYVLDEPTVGLHARDTRRLLDSLLDLRDRGTSLVLVEHDLDVVASADYVIDLGPGAGKEGGRIIGTGTPAELRTQPDSLTGSALQRRSHFPELAAPATFNTDSVRIENATARNLKRLSVDIPLGGLVALTGVSGSGKSTVVMETLVPALKAELSRREQAALAAEWERRGKGRTRNPDTTPVSGPSSPAVAAPGKVTGGESLSRVVVVDQTPLGRTGRSNPATAAGLWGEIRRFFARTPAAKLRGFTSRRFSLQAAGGRCERCRGHGVTRVKLDFLPDLQVTCPACRGKRFNAATLEAKFRGLSIADVLDLRIDAACDLFENFPRLRASLESLVAIGLGYLTLGQPANTLSGGEAQRLKLGRELLAGQAEFLLDSGRDPNGKRTLFVLDEPTSGLHVADIDRLLRLFRRLIGEGHSVLVIEHHLDVIAASDWMIDLGPEGGAQGGEVVAQGTPASVRAKGVGHTAIALRALAAT